MAPDNFHLFPSLPQEIQDIIWELCLPRRVISPRYTSGSQERVGRLPGAKSHTDLPLRALIPFRRSPLISRVCRAARDAVLRCGKYIQVLLEEFLEEGDDSTSRALVWLNKSDWVYLDYFAMIGALDVSDVPPQVFELARDATVPLLISAEIQSDHELVLLNTGNKSEETIGSRLYNSFLSRREHFYIVMTDLDLVVSGADREHVVKTGLFGLVGEDTAIVPTSDKAMMQQCISLYNAYDARDSREPSIAGSEAYIMHQLSNGDPRAVSREHDPRFILCGILKRVCEERGEFDISADDMLREDGSLKPDHPVVERLGITMPTYEAVALVRLRHLETLLEDSNLRSSWDSDDSADTEFDGF